MRTNPSKNLKIYAVWEPILRFDSENVARKATLLLPDSRVTHYWRDGQEVGEMFQAPIGLTTEPAWDVYLVYPPGVRWADKPPVPFDYMHKLGGRLPPEKRIDGEKLGKILEGLLEKTASE